MTAPARGIITSRPTGITPARWRCSKNLAASTLSGPSAVAEWSATAYIASPSPSPTYAAQWRSPRPAIVTLLLLGPLLVFSGKSERAEAYFRDAIELCQRDGDRFHLCVAYLNRAWLWLAGQDAVKHGLQRALDDLQRARRIARETGQPLLERGAAYNLAEILHWSGQHDAALGYARRAVRLQRFLPEPVVNDILLVARVLAGVRRWSEAEPHTERARTLAEARPGSLNPGEAFFLCALELLVRDPGYSQYDDAPLHPDPHRAPGTIPEQVASGRRTWRELVVEAKADLAAEEALEILYFSALHAERVGDAAALQEALDDASERLEKTPLWTGLFAGILARARTRA